MVGLARTAHDVLRCLASARLPACLIGGLAVQRWGEPRATQDVDLSVLAPFGDEARPLDVLLEAFRPRTDDAREFALRYRVLRVESEEGIGIDVSLAALPFEIGALDRAVDWALASDIHLRVCTAEDLLVYKLVAARPRDLLDIEGIVRLQHRTLDIRRVRSETRLIADALEGPDLLEPFEAALRRVR